MTTAAVVTTMKNHHRSSRRLRGLPADLHAAAAAADDGPMPEERIDDDDMVDPKPLKKARRSLPKTLSSKPKTEEQSTKSDSSSTIECLPRTREKAVLRTNHHHHSASSSPNTIRYVLGVDEAGRGPLAGPVVAAAVWLPIDIPGIIDSKKITAEAAREALYEQIMLAALDGASSEIKWAVAVVDAQRIDEINILQATLLGMRMSLQALMDCPQADELILANEANVAMPGTYVVTNQSSANNSNNNIIKPFPPNACYALVDGNRLPADLPCPGETIVKGDGREYAIAAASILAKVTRDRLMHGYDALYPAYGLAQHKGYPTAAHMAAVHTHGASPIHRRTFAPLKHWEFDVNGKIVGDKKVTTTQSTSKKTKKTTTTARKKKEPSTSEN